jgi:hypothetical protein
MNLPVVIRREKRPPTDFELVQAIYERHRVDFAAAGESATFIPIEIPAIAADLNASTQSVFGRLYHHLDPKYAQEPDAAAGRTARKSFFALRVGEIVNAINFPMLEALYAGLWQQRRRDLGATYAAVAALGISLASLIVSLAR